MEELELVMAAKEGDKEAAAQLYEMHRGLVVYHAAKEYRDSPLSFEDVESQCNMVFMESIRTYRGDTGLSFGRYFGGNIFHSLMTYRRKSYYPTISLPDHVVTALANKRLGKEVAHKSRLLIEDAEQLCAIDTDHVLSNEGGEEGATTWGDLHLSTPDVEFRDGYRVEGLLRTLPKVEEEVLRLHFYEDMQFSEIGRMVGVSRQRIHQRYNSAINRLKGVLV